jgi:hypothetical protein
MLLTRQCPRFLQWSIYTIEFTVSRRVQAQIAHQMADSLTPNRSMLLPQCLVDPTISVGRFRCRRCLDPDPRAPVSRCPLVSLRTSPQIIP